MVKAVRVSIMALLLSLFSLSVAFAHFGVIIPTDDIITPEDSKTIQLDIKFMHPMEGVYMEMVKPKRVGVLIRGSKLEDITSTIKPKKIKGPEQEKEFTYWNTSYRIKRPGDYIFFVEPQPYWEPAEDKFIIHYTKVCVNALGMEEGWDAKVNLPIEIIPLTRPYGIWTGNVFRGQVLLNGKPAPFIDVEVEYMNPVSGSDRVHPPADPFITQVIKTDANGVFTYAMPRAGWWGFAALADAPWRLKYKGQKKDVEIGGVFWVHTVDMK